MLDPELSEKLSEEERRLLDRYGSLDELMKALEERLKEQKERHEGEANGTHGAHHRLGRMATIPKVRLAENPAKKVPSRCGSNANTVTRRR